MKHLVILLMLLIPLIALDAQQHAPAGLPIVRPTVSVLPELHDSAGRRLPGAGGVSPNGRLILYNGCTAGPDVCIWNIASHQTHVIVTGPVHVLTWGPKGDMVALRTDPGSLRYKGEEVSRDQGILTIRVDSLTGEPLEPPRFAAKLVANHGAFLSPDERMIAFMQAHGWYVSSIAVVPTAGGTPRIIASGIEVHGVRWTRDGSSLYYNAHVNSSSPTRTEFIVSASGGDPVVVEQQRPIPPDITDNDEEVCRLGKERTIAYMTLPVGVHGCVEAVETAPGHFEGTATRHTRPRGLRIVDLENGGVRNLLDTASEVINAPAWSVDGRIAALVRQGDKTVLFLENADGSHARSLRVRHVQDEGEAAFRAKWEGADQLRISPDGRRAAFHGRANGYGTIEVVDLTTGTQRTLVLSPYDFDDGSAPEGRGIGSIAWSGDSKSILYLSDIWSAEPRVCQVTLSGAKTTLRRLPNFVYGPPPLSFPSTTQPRFVEFAGARNRQGGGSVALVPVDGGLPRVVLAEPGYIGPLSPDRRTLAIPINAAGGKGIELRLVSVDGSNTRTLAIPFNPLPGIEWHPDNRRLFLMGREHEGGPVNVYSLPLDGSALSVVTSTGAAACSDAECGSDVAMAVSPNGRFLAVAVPAKGTATFLKLQYDLPGKAR